MRGGFSANGSTGGNLTINGTPTSTFDNTGSSGGADINADVVGVGTFNVGIAYSPQSLEFHSAVGPGQTINDASGELKIDAPDRFAASINWTSGNFAGAPVTAHLGWCWGAEAAVVDAASGG